MSEAFLHYLWKMKLLNHSALETTSGESISIQKTGEHNSDAGPDFLNAKIKIGNTTWAGHVEIHVKSSDWLLHNHEADAAYNNVILHVVYEHDVDVKTEKGNILPTLELNGKFDKKLFAKYELLQSSPTKIPCEKLLSAVNEFTIRTWLQRVLIERLEEKTKRIESSLERNKSDWETTFYHQLARAFGSRLNGDAFQQMAETLPLQVLAKNKNNLQILESLVFGCAGWLNGKLKDDYMLQLQKEFLYQQKKYNLTSIAKHNWKLLRLRPANFPTVRLAQFASLVHNSSHLLSKILDANSVSDLRKLFKTNCSDYWQTHFLPDKKVKEHSAQLTDDFIDLLLINTIVPIVFLYGKLREEESFQTKALNWLEEITSENNFITRDWKVAGIKSKSAFDSQALIHLRKNYCDNKQCLRCAIGHSILKQ